MRILLICPVLPYPNTGTGTREFNLLKQLSRDHQFVVITTAFPDQRQQLGVLSSCVETVFSITLDYNQTNDSFKGRIKNRIASWTQTLLDRTPKYHYTYPLAKMRTAIWQAKKSFSFDLVHVVAVLL